MIKLKLTDTNQKEFETALNQEMDKSIKHFERELVGIRTGRAHPALVEDIKATVYDNKLMRIKELASISTPDSRMIIMQPWDKAIVPDIEKALLNSDLGVKPTVEGTVIRIYLPEMTSARRGELQKILAKKLEDTKISIRNVRKDFLNLIRDSEKARTVSEDHANRLSNLLQKITDSFTEKCTVMGQKKEKEILTV